MGADQVSAYGSSSWRLLGCHGFSAMAPWQLLELAVEQGLTDAPGDVVVAAERRSDGQTETILATSGIGARPYFWAEDETGHLHHGTDVFSVVRTAGLGWEWDPDGLQQLALLGHTLGTTTLHRRVARLPPDSVLRADRDGVSISTGTLWEEPPTTGPQNGIEQAF